MPPGSPRTVLRRRRRRDRRNRRAASGTPPPRTVPAAAAPCPPRPLSPRGARRRRTSIANSPRPRPSTCQRRSGILPSSDRGPGPPHLPFVLTGGSSRTWTRRPLDTASDTQERRASFRHQSCRRAPSSWPAGGPGPPGRPAAGTPRAVDPPPATSVARRTAARHTDPNRSGGNANRNDFRSRSAARLPTTYSSSIHVTRNTKPSIH